MKGQIFMQNPWVAGFYEGLHDISAIEDLGLQTCCILTTKFELIRSDLKYLNKCINICKKLWELFYMSLFLEWKRLLKKIRQAQLRQTPKLD